MDIFIGFCDLLLPLAMIIIGAVFSKHPPKEINDVSGYRTTMSMKNEDTWAFAQKLSARIFFIAGIFVLIFSAAALIVFKVFSLNIADITLWIIIPQLLILILTIIPVEAALHKRFDNDGHLR